MRKFGWLLFVALALVMTARFWRSRPVVIPAAAKVIANGPATHPATVAIIVAPKIANYIDLVRLSNPLIPATQPLGLPVDLSDAAHLILHDPAYLDPAGHLWITRSGSPSTEEALRSPMDPSEHLIAEAPVFVHWIVNDNGDWSAYMVTRRSDGGFDIVSSLDRRPLTGARHYRWEAAFSWDGQIVVPTDGGVSIFQIEPKIHESYHALLEMTGDHNPPIAILDSRGILAWAPWEKGRRGSRGASRFVDGRWVDLPADQWAAKILQLVPLLDGSVLQIVAGDGDAVSLSIAPLETSGIDAHRVAQLIDGLSDDDSDKRQAAIDELTRYGPGLWPILEKVTDQPLEARVRIGQLLRGKIAPALNGMTLIDNRLSVVNRQSDGTALFYAQAGVMIPGIQQIISPAWIAIYPGGRVDRPLPKQLIADQRPDKAHLFCIHDDWLVCDGTGVRRFIGNALVPMLKPEEREFSKVIGVDRRGRWLFKKADHSSAETLIIDPTILDPTPRLPVWNMTIRKGSAGWTRDGYPAIKRGGAWVLGVASWEPLSDRTDLETERPTPSPPATGSSEAIGAPLLVTQEGTRYFDGTNELISVDKDGRKTRWPLLGSAIGSDKPTLLSTPDGLLFLFNQPGRVLRIKHTPSAAEPFEVQATFTTDIPNTAHATRIWLDPLGRIDMVYDGNGLAVMFPSGHIPGEIAQMRLEKQ
jgi:hypothetical protein